MVYVLMPDPTSVPDQFRITFLETLAGKGSALLTGLVLSMVFSHSFVSIGTFRSKTIVA